MVAAVARYLGEPKTRDELRRVTFDTFGGEKVIAKYWPDTRTAFDAALARGVELRLLIAAGEHYSAGWEKHPDPHTADG